MTPLLKGRRSSLGFEEKSDTSRNSRNTIIDLLRIVAGDAKPGYLLCEVNMTYSSALLSKLRARGVKATVTALLVKAIGIAQESHYKTRTESIPIGSLVTYNNIVAGFTVERIVDGQPTVFLCEIEEPNSKSIQELSRELRQCATDSIDDVASMRMQRVFSHLPAFLRQLILVLGKSFPYLRLKCQKASFGLTSLGKFGVSALLSPCLCSSTVGVGMIEDRAVVVNGEIRIQTQMTVSLNYDMRVFDYIEADLFLGTVRLLLEGSLEQFLSDSERLGEDVYDLEPIA